jgi:hypothetical protein
VDPDILEFIQKQQDYLRNFDMDKFIDKHPRTVRKMKLHKETELAEINYGILFSQLKTDE